MTKLDFGKKRGCGILMPIASLPGAYGIGDFSSGFGFVDFLVNAKQTYWQILPIGPTGYGDSPYQSFSAFSGNPYFISLDILEKNGLLTKIECETAKCQNDFVNYTSLYETRLHLLHIAADRTKTTKEFEDFCEKNQSWLSDYSLFMAIKNKYGDVSWQKWPQALRMRETDSLKQIEENLKDEICFHKKIQYWFYRQWIALKNYANNKGVQIIGDIPIYVSPDSSDVWAESALFALDDDKRQISVAGVPPDAFSVDGQVWGNPLYNWNYHAQTNYEWWVRRLRHASTIYDVTRIDHFRAFCDYFVISSGENTARNGKWQIGPGKAFINAIKSQIPNISVIAEDLGYLSPEVSELLKYSGFPGMKVLQFAFDSREAGDYLPYRYDVNSVVYTGTHDNTTTADWEFSAPKEDVIFAKDYLDVTTGRSLTEGMIRAALACVSFLVIIPLQDWLELDATARINTPSTLGGNWVWRVDSKSLSQKLSDKITKLTNLYGRAE